MCSEDVWNEESLNRYMFTDVVAECVAVLAYEYIEKNKGKKPTTKMINEWTAKLLRDENEIKTCR